MQEIVVSGGKIIELLRPDANRGKVHTLLTMEVFGNIRSLMAFRLTGGTKDYIVVGSDSGLIMILEYHLSNNTFEKIHQETFGKSGCRSIIPGQFLAVDPQGQFSRDGAIEKQKLVYILNRDAAARLTISSPLEVHKANLLVYHVVGVDVGFENPMFACLETDYEEADNDPTREAASNTQQTLTFYELDLGLNHVVCKYSEALEVHGNFLITVPGGSHGPSGVFICSENYITYKNFGNQPDIRCPIPRRRMRMKYFDTIPVATAMCVLKTGFLFVSSEFGNHYLYQIAHLGDDDEEPEFSSAMHLEGDFFTQPRPLKNLVLVDEQENLSPISCHVCVFMMELRWQQIVFLGSSQMKALVQF